MVPEISAAMLLVDPATVRKESTAPPNFEAAPSANPPNPVTAFFNPPSPEDAAAPAAPRDACNWERPCFVLPVSPLSPEFSSPDSLETLSSKSALAAAKFDGSAASAASCVFCMLEERPLHRVMAFRWDC